MTVRAKFRCAAIERVSWDGKEVQNVKLSAVVGNSEENKAFFEATPSGSVVLGTVNAKAAAQFEPGAEYYIDFTRAE